MPTLNYDATRQYSVDIEGSIIVANKIHSQLDFVKGKRVLEVGPMTGFFTDMLLSYDPASITLVEFDKQFITTLENQYKNNDKVEIVCKDIFFYINENVKKFDVVILFGVLYHFHSALWLLELCANYIDPEYICVDSPFSNDANQASITNEPDNKAGARQILSSWKSAGITVVVPYNCIKTALSNLGYSEFNFIPPFSQIQWKENFYWSFYKKK